MKSTEYFFAENRVQCVQKYFTYELKACMCDGNHNTDGQALHKALTKKGKDLVRMFKKNVDIFIVSIIIFYFSSLII